MSTLAYPSPDFPGLPSVALDVPEGWEPAYAPGTTMAARLPRTNGFSPNVVVSIEQCVAGHTVERSLEQIAEMARSRGGDVSEPFAAQLGDAEFIGCDATWPDPDVDSVLQANLFHIVRTGGPGIAGYLVQLTGAVAGPDAEPDYELIRDVLTTVRVTPWAVGGQPASAVS